MNSRTLLIIFGALILAGVIALLVALQAGPPATESRAAAPAPRIDDAPGAVPAAATDGPTGRRAQPEVTPTAGGEDAEDVLEYVTDGGILVRDHRADKSAPAPLDGLPRPGQTRRMQPGSVAAVRNVLRPIVRRCEQAMTGVTLGADPVLQVVVTVSVRDQRLTVDKVQTHTRDMGPSELGACVREAFAGRQLDAPNEEDVAAYDLTHPFRITGR